MDEKQLTPEEHDKIMQEVMVLINATHPPYNGVPMDEVNADALEKLEQGEFDPASTPEAVSIDLDNEGEATDKLEVELGAGGDQIISSDALDAMANAGQILSGTSDNGPVGPDLIQYPGSDIIDDSKLEADANQNDDDVTQTDLLNDANDGTLSGQITLHDLLADANAGEYLTNIGIGASTVSAGVAGVVPENSLSITPEALDAIVSEVDQKAISKRPDVSPKEGMQKYGKVTFADPTNKKYPIDTEEHIRAAWNYINKAANAAKYSGGEASAIKRRIVSAWKKVIDPAGPPAAKKDVNFETDDLLTYEGASELKDLGEGRIGGYAIRFSTKSDPDLTLDYFDKNESSIEYPHSDMPVYYLHGRDDKMGKKSIGRTVATKTDDVGVWMETQLNMRDEYEKAILNMAKSGKLGYSTGALPHMVERDPRGKGINLIKTWVVGELSLTPMPAEPRLTVVPLKSLSTSEMSALPNEEGDKTYSDQFNIGVSKMDNQDEIKAVVAAAFEERDSAEKSKAKRMTELKVAAEAGYKQALKELKEKNLLKVAPAVVKSEQLGDDNDGMQAFNSYVKTGEVNGGLVYMDGKSWTKQTVGSSDVKAAYNVTTGGQGGFLVPDPLYQQIIAKRQLRSWVRQAPVQFFSTPADHILVPVENTLAANFTITAEAGNYTEDEPTVAQRDIILYKFTKNVRMSEEFVNYNTTNFDAWLTDALARAEAVTENQIFTLGTGTGQPQGVLPNGAALAGTQTSTVAWGSLTATAAADLSYIVGLLPAGYNVAPECIFLMSNTNKWLAKAAAAVFFAFVPTPTPQDFWGYPAYVVDGLPLIGTSSGVGSHIFMNATMYGVAEKPGLLIQRNPYLHMQTGQIDIYANMYRGGAVLQPEAIVYSLNHA